MNNASGRAMGAVETPATREPMVRSDMKRLECELEELHEALDGLKGRLESVLMPLPDEKMLKPPDGPKAIHMMPQLCEWIDKLRVTTAGAKRHVNELVERLEV